MLGALLGLVIWLLGFTAAGLGFFSLFDPVLADLFDVLMTWATVPVVSLALLTLVYEGVPSGAGEVKSAMAWVRRREEQGKPADLEDAPVNAVLVGLELGAVILAGFGLVLSSFFSLMITASLLGGAGSALSASGRLTIAGVEASDSFAVFLAGGLLWQVAWIAEAFEIS